MTEINLPQILFPYFESISPPERPQFHQLWDVNGITELVSCRFGEVPKGSLLSYQLPVVSDSTDNVIVLSDVPSQPPFTFPDLSPFVQSFLPVTDYLQNTFSSLEVSGAMSREFEEATRSQSSIEDWHRLRKNRITASKFKRICSRRSNFDSLATQFLSNRTVTTSSMRFGIENEPVAAEMYAKDFGRNVYRVGFVINPTCSFLGASPDRRVFDPDVNEWGLLEIKCTISNSVANCEYLALSKKKENQQLMLKRSHEYYYQVMGQMGITGSAWCDFFVMARDDYHVERIVYEESVFHDIMSKLCSFFFTTFLSRIQ